MDLIQVPVLVLDSERNRMKPIPASRFTVSLDAGPPFHPRRVRQEGDDPITLAILLDVNGDQARMMKDMDQDLAKLVPESLHPADHVSLYTLDCTLMRSLNDVAADPEALRLGTEHALQPWITRIRAKHQPCEKHVNLLDSLAYIVKELSSEPGRRVVLAVTDGRDHGSVLHWNDIMDEAQKAGVAIFGMIPAEGPNNLGVPRSMQNNPLNSSEDPFGTLCQLSGGMVLSADRDNLKKRLPYFVTLVRERYILEFSRPRNDLPGKHLLDVKVGNPMAFVRAAGVAVLIRDPGLEDDPMTIKRDTADAPEFGNRKVLSRPQ